MSDPSDELVTRALKALACNPNDLILRDVYIEGYRDGQVGEE